MLKWKEASRCELRVTGCALRKIDRYLPRMLMLAFPVNGLLFRRFGNVAISPKWLLFSGFANPGISAECFAIW